VLPVVTPTEMAAIDAAAPEPVTELIERAGAAVARTALRMLGGAYGRRVVVLVGKGNNGRDGLAAARRLRACGVAAHVVDVASPTGIPATADLVIDAAYGTGFRGTFEPPELPDAPVLAVDVPSGVDGTTGEVHGRAMAAEVTVTFAALKPGLCFGEGRRLAGEVEVVDIGLDVSSARAGLVQRADVGRWVPPRAASDHKWTSATWVVGGSAGMGGAAALAAAAAFRAGAGYVRLSTPGGAPAAGAAPVEAVGLPLPLVGWDRDVLAGSDRVRSLVVGPGLGRSEAVGDAVRRLATAATVPMVLDGDALWAVAALAGRMADAPRVLTPHDGEYAQLCGHPPGADRLDAARRLAALRSSIVLLKGPTTVVAAPDGRCRLVTSGDAGLASAGTGDVLSGVLGALLARGVDAFDAAAAAAAVHGWAAAAAPAAGLVASDLPRAVGAVLAELAPTVAR